MPLATVLICGVAILCSLGWLVSAGFGDWVINHLLADAYLVFGSQPWLLVTSPFIHTLIPHLIFNIVTFGVYGTLAERYFGSVTVFVVFLSGALIANVFAIEYDAIRLGTTVTLGISGGVCAVFGFLLAAYPPMRRPRRVREWLLVLVYPALLLLLFVVEWFGIAPTGTVHHLTGVVFGALLGLSRGAGRSRPAARTATTLVLLASVVMIVYSPWLAPWRAAHDDLPVFTPNSEVEPPASPLTQEPPMRALFFRNSGHGGKVVYWEDVAGREHPLTFTPRIPNSPPVRTSRSAWSLPTGTPDSRPHGVSDRFILRNDQGDFITRIDLRGNPHSALIVDLGVVPVAD